MLHSETFAQVATALAVAQGAFPKIERSRTVTVRTKPKGDRPAGQYTYSYAPLETILAAVRKPLADNGLCLVQSPMMIQENGRAVEVIHTRLVHSSGEWFACDVPIFVSAGDNAAQAYASGLTYSRRYGVTNLLCVAADEDDDAGGDRDDLHRQGSGPVNGYLPSHGGPQMPNRRQAQPSADELEAALREVDARPPSKAAQPGIGPAAAPEEADPTLLVAPRQDAVVDPATGEIPSPWGSDLTDGQAAMAQQRAKTAGLSDPAVLERFGVITQSNLRESLAKLKELADKELER